MINGLTMAEAYTAFFNVHQRRLTSMGRVLPMIPADIHDRDWHVRILSLSDDGRRVGIGKLRTLQETRLCSCSIWVPTMIEQTIRRGVIGTQRVDVISGYVLLGQPQGELRCGGACTLPLRRLPVDVDDSPLTADELSALVDLESSVVTLTRGIEPGDLVRVTDTASPWRNRVGEFNGLTSRGFAAVLFNLFGERIVEVMLPPNGIELEDA